MLSKFFKIIYKFCLIILTLSLIALISIPYIFNINKYRTNIEKIIFNKTKIEVKINGNMSYSLFPFLSLKLNNIVLTNPKFPINNPEYKEFLKIDFINIEISTIQALLGKIHIKDIKIIKPYLNLVSFNKTTNINFSNISASHSVSLKENNTNNQNPKIPAINLAVTTTKTKKSLQKYLDNLPIIKKWQIKNGSISKTNLITNDNINYKASKNNILENLNADIKLNKDITIDSQFVNHSEKFSLSLNSVDLNNDSLNKDLTLKNIKFILKNGKENILKSQFKWNFNAKTLENYLDGNLNLIINAAKIIHIDNNFNVIIDTTNLKKNLDKKEFILI